MIHIKGDALKLFKESITHTALIHQVNCQGVMGSGIAKQIKEHYPTHFKDYIDYCEMAEASALLGDCIWTPIGNDPFMLQIVAGAFAQYQFGHNHRHTNYAALTKSICAIIDQLPPVDEFSLIIPKYLGCGLGGGDWSIIKQILLDVEKMYDIEFTCVECES